MPEALVWGASGGMGQALTRLLHEQGWKVYAAARTTSNVPDVADKVFEFDAANPHDYKEIAMLIAQESDGLNLVAYMAGNLSYDKLVDMGYEGWMATLDSNLNGAYLAANHSLNLMNKGAHLFFIGAYVDHVELPKMGAYAAAKAGLEELALLLAKENRRMNITLVRPGAVNTPFWEQVSFSMPDDAKDPSEVAQAIWDKYESGEGGNLDM